MALTQAAVNAWRQSVDQKAGILETGLGLLNAQTAKKEIPNFTGEIVGKLAIEEWFKIAERIATNAGWNDAQKLRSFVYYQFNRMPFGFTNAPATFQRLMNHILRSVIRKFALVY